MRTFLLTALTTALLLMAATGAFADETIYANPDIKENATVLKSGPNSVTVRFAVPQVKAIDQYYVEFGLGSVFRIPGGSVEAQVGAPDVAMIRRGIQIPNTGNVEIEILSEEIEEIGDFDVVPAQEPRSTCLGPAPYALDEEVYSKNEYFPSSSVRIDSIQILRDIRVARVRYYPIRTNPVSGSTILTTSIDVKFTFTQNT